MKWAVLGLENMFNGGAAVFAAATHPDADTLELRVRGEGSLLMYLSERPQNVFCGNVEGVPLEFSYADGEGLLRVVLPPRFQVFWRLPTSAVLYYCCSLLLRFNAADLVSTPLAGRSTPRRYRPGHIAHNSSLNLHDFCI